jgi:hypothetical protein
VTTCGPLVPFGQSCPSWWWCLWAGWKKCLRSQWATFLPITAPCVSAVRKWIPPQTRAPMTSSSAREKRSKCLGCVGKRELTTSNAILSVPKKSRIAFSDALLTQP